MKRLLSILLLFALVALPGCGGAEGVPVTTPTDTETESVTEPLRQLRETVKMETATCIVFEKADYITKEIWVRDKATREESLLLERSETYDRLVPNFSQEINERYFVYHYAVPETCHVDDFQIYDLQKRQTVDIKHPEWVFIDRIADGKLYLKSVKEYEDIVIKTYTIAIAALDSDGPIIPKEVR